MKNACLTVVTISAALLAPLRVQAQSPAQMWADRIGWQALDYADEANWVCSDRDDDICSDTYTRVDLLADGSAPTTRERFDDDQPEADCFYIYPTVTLTGVRNADAEVTPLIEQAVLSQAAPFGRACRVFAPLYRQMSLAGYNDPMGPVLMQNALADVMAGWEHYLSTWNQGRPVIVMGHSQGTQIAAYLLRRYFDGRAPLSGIAGVGSQYDLWLRLAAAYLIGGNVYAPEGRLEGGSFEFLTGCGGDGQNFCFVSYRTYPEGFADEPSAVGIEGIDPHFAMLGFLHRARDAGDRLVAFELPFEPVASGRRAAEPCAPFGAVSAGSTAVFEDTWLYQGARCRAAQRTCLSDPSVACQDDSDCEARYTVLPARYTSTLRAGPGGNPGLFVGLHAPRQRPLDPRGDPLNVCSTRNDALGLHRYDYGVAMGDLLRDAAFRVESWYARQEFTDAGPGMDASADGGAVSDSGPQIDGATDITDAGMRSPDGGAEDDTGVGRPDPARPNPGNDSGCKGCSSSERTGGTSLAWSLLGAMLLGRRRRAQRS